MSLIQARVKPGNKYGPHYAGEIIEVTAEELAQVPHCLEDVKRADSERAQALAEEAAKIARGQEAFEAGRNAQIASRKASEDAMLLRKQNELAQVQAEIEEAKKPKAKK